MLLMLMVGFTSAGAAPAFEDGAGTRVIIELEKPPLLGNQGFAIMGADNQIDVNSPDAQAYIEELKADQATLARAAGRSVPGARMGQYIDENGETHNLGYQIAFNGLTLSVPDDDPKTLRKLMQLSGVKRIYPVQEYEINMDASLPLIGLGDPEAGTMVTDGLWDLLGGPTNAGTGLKVAVLDTGIDIHHDFFDPTGFAYPAGYPKGNAAYTTEKVIVARAYYRADDPPVHNNPLDYNGHGSHTSGTIAGNYGVTATVGTYDQIVSGIAPQAHLMNYQIFYKSTSGSESAWNAEILRALDDLVADGADVTNNSWGGLDNLLMHADPIAQAFQNIIDHDIVAVKSAGNAGRGQGSVDPTGPDDILLVGATTTARSFGNQLDVTAPGASIPSTITQILATESAFTPSITETFGPETYVYVGRLEAANFEGCDPFGAAAADIAGNIALISRGSCAFVDKVENAYDAGAAGVVIFNNVKGAPPITMGGDPTAKTVIPAFMVGNEPGLALAAWEADNVGDAKLQIGAETAKIVDAKPDDIIADFSATGPDIALNIKPDILAPGVDILSSVADNKWSTYQGTSMAAPHVAGAAVLLRQLYPTWSVHEIKSALMTSAKVEGLYNDYPQTDPAGAMDRGAGRIDLVAAGDPGIVVDMPSLSFGEMEPGDVMTYTVTATNVATTTNVHTYTTAISETGTVTATANFTLSVTPDTVGIDDAGDDTIDVVMEIPANAEPGDYDGLVWLRHGTHEAHIPVWVRVVPKTTMADVLVIDDDFSLFGFPDYAYTYTQALDTAGVSYAVWETDMAWYLATGNTGGLPDVATLQEYKAVLWFTGDSFYSYYNYGAMVDDRWAMLDYLRSSGGKLAVFGQDFSGYQLSGDADSPYLPAIGLSADILGEDTFDLATGVPGADVRGVFDSPFEGIYLDFTGSTQVYVDELMPIGIDDQGLDYGGRPALEALMPGASGEGIVGVIRHVEPTLENGGVFDSPNYRTAYMSFGLEGVNEANSTVTHAELVEMLYKWLTDEVTVEIKAGAGGAANTLISIEAEAMSSVDAAFTQFRWDFDDGTPEVTTSESTVSHIFDDPGTYTVTVEAMDTYGHTALGTGNVLVNEGVSGETSNDVGSGDMPMAGDEVKQTIVMHSTVPTPTTALMVNPLPMNTEYVTHTGGTWVGDITSMAPTAVITTPGGNTLSITNSLYLTNTFTSAGETVTMTLTFKVVPGTSADEDIVNVSKFWVGGDDDYFERRTTLDLWGNIYLPLIMRQ